MKKLFYYYTEDAQVKAEELSKEFNGTVRSGSYDKIYDCDAMDNKAEDIINNGVNGETGAFIVENDNLDTVAIVAHWISKECDE